jgi:glucose/mannose-6-phosphate isomerase
MTREITLLDKIYTIPKFSEMTRMIDEQPTYYKRGIELGWRIKKEEVACPRTVYFYGLGGSGIVGQLFSVVFTSYTKVPIIASNSVKIADWLGPDDLLVVVSYSGETFETLRAFNEARRKGVRVIAMTSDGSLAEMARKNGVQLIELSKGFPPRMSLPEMAGAAASMLDNIDVTINAAKALLESAEMLIEVVKENNPNSPFENNTAKKAAIHLYGSIPGVFCSGHLYVSGIRLKNQLNENAKYPCIVHEIPESMHNTLEALPYSERDKYLLFRSSNETVDITSQMRFIASMLGDALMEVWFRGSVVYEALASIMWSDYVSIYLAALREVDPMTVARIAALRKELERSIKKT